jgi:hypothetical protein
MLVEEVGEKLRAKGNPEGTALQRVTGKGWNGELNLDESKNNQSINQDACKVRGHPSECQRCLGHPSDL